MLLSIIRGNTKEHEEESGIESDEDPQMAS